MKYYIIAGEASGDLHGSNLVKALHRQDKNASVRCWGGDKMEAAGATLVKHYRDLAFMGFVEVIKHLGTIMGNLSFCKKDILAFQPDVLVLIDYPGFNLRIAEWASKQGLKIVYYISPQVWAWKENRVKLIRRVVDKMLVILPFEQDFYRKWQYDVVYTGHPLLEAVQQHLDNVPPPVKAEKPVVALLPGSRQQEVLTKLPVMLSVVRDFPDYQFVVAKAPSLPDALFTSIIGDMPVQLAREGTYQLLRQAAAALVTSGTATLETALFGVPQVVCYRGNPLSYWLARKLVKVKYISLVNLIMDAPVVTELIQGDLNHEHLQTELSKLLHDTPELRQMRNRYQLLKSLLGEGNASDLAATEIISLAQNTNKHV